MKNLNRLLFISLCAAFATAAQADQKPWPRRPGVVLYEMKADASETQRTALAALFAKNRAAAALSVKVGGTRRALSAGGSARTEEELAQDLLNTGAVAYAEPDYRMPPAAVPNDPSYGLQWHHAAIHSPAAWDLTTGARSVTVAVCDTGVDDTHPDLADNMSLPGYNAADGGSNTAPIADHGTAVAGIIGELGNNGMGATGVAWNIKILPVRITNSTDASAWCSDMAAGIEWAADHQAQAINLSYDITGCPRTIDAAARYAQDRGAVVIAAAGNSGINLAGSFPTPHTLVLVGATDAAGKRAGFSNYGAVDVSAPGVAIYSTLPGNTYAYGTGTSFAAPMVTGIAALLFSLNPHWTPAQVRSFMTSTAQPASSLGGTGTIDAAAALGAAQNVLLGNAAAPGGGTQSTLDAVVVYPNPWRADRHGGDPIIFTGLTSASTVRIFTLSGFLVRTLSENSGQAVWDLKNNSGDRAASGVYFYSITDSTGHKAEGKIGVIR